jgi:enoyl-CoA hydratase/carnithine racemase
MNFRTLSYEKLGAVLRITANRPEVLNAQSRVIIVELDEASRRWRGDVVTGAASWPRRPGPSGLAQRDGRTPCLK